MVLFGWFLKLIYMKRNKPKCRPSWNNALNAFKTINTISRLFYILHSFWCMRSLVKTLSVVSTSFWTIYTGIMLCVWFNLLHSRYALHSLCTWVGSFIILWTYNRSDMISYLEEEMRIQRLLSSTGASGRTWMGCSFQCIWSKSARTLQRPAGHL